MTMNAARRGELENIALEVRKDVVRMLGVARAGGFKRAAGITDVLVYLYWEHMRVFPRERGRRERDRFVLGKGDAAPALYACLARRGFFGRDELWSYSRLGAMLQGYPDVRTPGVDAPWSSDGCVGVACGLAASLAGTGARVFCLADGYDVSVGFSWESMVSAAADGAGNLALLISPGAADGRVAPALSSFGWTVAFADAGDYDSIDEAMRGLDYDAGNPKAVVLRARDRAAENLGSGEEDAPMSKDDVDNVISLLDTRDAAL
jgi:transketolase